MDYLFALIYIVVGLAGASGHYFKKRYIDRSTNDKFLDYIHLTDPNTQKAILSIVGAEILLSLSHTTGWSFPLSELVACVTTGYASDSIMNRSSEQT